MIIIKVKQFTNELRHNEDKEKHPTQEHENIYTLHWGGMRE